MYPRQFFKELKKKSQRGRSIRWESRARGICVMLQLKVQSFHANSCAAHMIPFFITSTRFGDFNVCPTSMEIHEPHILGNFSSNFSTTDLKNHLTNFFYKE